MGVHRQPAGLGNTDPCHGNRGQERPQNTYEVVMGRGNQPAGGGRPIQKGREGFLLRITPASSALAVDNERQSASSRPALHLTPPTALA